MRVPRIKSSDLLAADLHEIWPHFSEQKLPVLTDIWIYEGKVYEKRPGTRIAQFPAFAWREADLLWQALHKQEAKERRAGMSLQWHRDFYAVAAVPLSGSLFFLNMVTGKEQWPAGARHVDYRRVPQ